MRVPAKNGAVVVPKGRQELRLVGSAVTATSFPCADGLRQKMTIRMRMGATTMRKKVPTRDGTGQSARNRAAPKRRSGKARPNRMRIVLWVTFGLAREPERYRTTARRSWTG